MPYLGGIYVTTISITKILSRIFPKVTRRSLMRPRHVTLLEPKEYKYL